MMDPGSEGFAPAYFDVLAAVEDRHFWFTSRNALLARLLEPIASTLPPAARILEVGAGTGNTLRVVERACPGASVFGLDVFREGFAFARSRCSAPLVQGGLEWLPFGETFDAVASFDVFEHVADDRRALRAVHAVLKRGGCLVLTVPAIQRLWSRFDDEAHHCRRYEFDELRGKLLDAGFQIERQTFVMATLYPLLKVARFLHDGRGGSAGARELQIVPLVNMVLKAFLAIENRVVASGYQPPIGTSLYAVARRTE